MDLSDEAIKTLRLVLNSWLSSHGIPFDELFKDHKDLEEVYQIVNEPEEKPKKKGVVSEATPKSTDERIQRSIRQTGKTRRTARHSKQRQPDMLGRITPKHTASSNDPSRGGNKIHNKKMPEDVKESVLFIKENLQNSGMKLKTNINEFLYKDTLKSVVEHMIATRLGGWHQEDDKFINESGHKASPLYWNLNKNGKLIPIGIDDTSDYEIEWFLEAKLYCG